MASSSSSIVASSTANEKLEELREKLFQQNTSEETIGKEVTQGLNAFLQEFKDYYFCPTDLGHFLTTSNIAVFDWFYENRNHPRIAFSPQVVATALVNPNMYLSDKEKQSTRMKSVPSSTIDHMLSMCLNDKTYKLEDWVPQFMDYSKTQQNKNVIDWLQTSPNGTYLTSLFAAGGDVAPKSTVNLVSA